VEQGHLVTLLFQERCSDATTPSATAHWFRCGWSSTGFGQTTANDKNLRKQILQSRVKSNVLNDSVVLKNFSNISKDNGGAVPGIVIPFSTVSQRG
jgi:hypothetical protein